MNEREEADRNERIRQRAYRMWEEEGCPEGRSDVHWDRAAELVAIEDNQRLATVPVNAGPALGPYGEPVEPIEAAENVGEFPTMTDQGEEQPFPGRRQTPEEPPLSVERPAAPATKTAAPGAAPSRKGEAPGQPSGKGAAGSARALSQNTANGKAQAAARSKQSGVRPQR